MGRKKKAEEDKLKPITITIRGNYISKHGYSRIKQVAQDTAREVISKL